MADASDRYIDVQVRVQLAGTIDDGPSRLAYEASLFRWLLEAEENTTETWLALPVDERIRRARAEESNPGLEDWVQSCKCAAFGS